MSGHFGLFLRSRRSGSALVVILAILAALRVTGSVVVQTGMERPILLPLGLLIPTALACVIGLSTESRMRPFDDMATRRIVGFRLGHVTVLFLVAAAGVLLATPDLGDDYGRWSATRNLAGLTGVTLLTATVAGASFSWLPAALLLGINTLLGGEGLGDFLWAWLIAPGGETSAAITAIALLGSGVASVTAVGDGGARRPLARVAVRAVIRR